MLAGYNYRKSITIGHSDDGAQTNYQLMLTIHRSAGADSGADVYVGTKCLDNYNDIRFTQSDGDTLLDYWIETSDANTATVWIEFNSVPASPGTATFYIYYGNAGAAAVSDGPTTFPFFDHFDGDLSKWTLTGLGTANIASSKVTVSGPAVANWTKIKGNVTKAFGAIRMLGSLSTVDYTQMGWLTDAGGMNNGLLWQWYPGPVRDFMSWDGAANVTHNTGLTGTDDEMVIWDIKWVAGTAKCYRAGSLQVTSTTTMPTVAVPAYIAAYHNDSSAIVDWILLRNWTTNEPTWDAWGAEQNLGVVGAPKGSMMMMGCGN